jgi:hypothetical protein
MKISPILARRLKRYENLANFGKESEKGTVKVGIFTQMF